MSFVTDLASDYTIWDGGETVTIRGLRHDGAVSTTISNAINGALGRNTQTTSGLMLVGDERQWSVNSTQLSTTEVEPGDILIQADGTQWDIISAVGLTCDTRWRIIARKQK